MGRVLTVLALGRVDWDVAADRLRALIRMKVRVEDDKHDEHTFRNPSVDAGHVSYSRATYRSQGRILIWDQTTAAVRLAYSSSGQCRGSWFRSSVHSKLGCSSAFPACV